MGVCRPVLQILTLWSYDPMTLCRVNIHTRFQTSSEIHTRFQTWPLGRNYVMITYIRAQTKNFFKCISVNSHISISLLFIYTFIRSRSSFENHTRFHTTGQSLYPFSGPKRRKNPTIPFGAAHTNTAYIKEFPGWSHNHFSGTGVILTF